MSETQKETAVSIPDKQTRIDMSNLRFYSQMFREYKWETDVIHWSVFAQTLDEIASRIEHDFERITAIQEEMEKLKQERDSLKKQLDACNLGWA